ncbi:plectin [Spirillospora sp. NPDC047279]|uniref:plectin n=1 Tax=Spirillospora sp. NPDC047279 TaxID=3155478 RepID=UPI0033D45D10
MSLGRRVSKDVSELYEADQRLAGEYRERLARAEQAEGELRAAEAGEGPADGRRELAIAFDVALTGVLLTAEAAERAEAGPKSYAAPSADAKARRDAEIAYRKAKARPAVRPWTDEVDRIRTAREVHRMTYRTSPAVAV